MKQRMIMTDEQHREKGMKICLDAVGTAKNINAILQEKNIDNKMLCRELGVSRQAIEKWRNGQSLPKNEMFIRLAHLLGMRWDDLVVCKWI